MDLRGMERGKLPGTRTQSWRGGGQQLRTPRRAPPPDTSMGITSPTGPWMEDARHRSKALLRSSDEVGARSSESRPWGSLCSIKTRTITSNSKADRCGMEEQCCPTAPAVGGGGGVPPALLGPTALLGAAEDALLGVEGRCRAALLTAAVPHPGSDGSILEDLGFASLRRASRPAVKRCPPSPPPSPPPGGCELRATADPPPHSHREHRNPPIPPHKALPPHCPQGSPPVTPPLPKTPPASSTAGRAANRRSPEPMGGNEQK